MAVCVKLETIIAGLECQGDESCSYLDKRTGEVIFIRDEEFRAAEDGDDTEDSPEWERDTIDVAKEIIQERGDYIQLPSKFEIHDYSIMEDFCHSVTETDMRDDLLIAIRGRGAFRCFRDTICRYDITEKWYAYRNNQYMQIAIDWCKEHGIECEEE